MFYDEHHYEQVKSNPSLKVWSHKSVKDRVKLKNFAKKVKFSKMQKKIARTKTIVFLNSNGHNLFRAIEET